jgi:group I intron endonuclease
MIAIYKIVSPSGKIYIGQTLDVARRFRQYKRLNCKSQIKLINSFNKYGIDAHCFEIIKELPEDTTQGKLNVLEQEYWNKYTQQGFEMLNLKQPGNQSRHSEETKKKIGLSHKGKKHIGTGEKVRAALKGRKMPDHIREKISKSHTGKKRSLESVLKSAAGHKGKTISEAQMDAIIKANTGRTPWNKGLKMNTAPWNKGVTGYTTKWKGRKTKKTIEKNKLSEAASFMAMAEKI